MNKGPHPTLILSFQATTIRIVRKALEDRQIGKRVFDALFKKALESRSKTTNSLMKGSPSKESNTPSTKPPKPCSAKTWANLIPSVFLGGWPIKSHGSPFGPRSG